LDDVIRTHTEQRIRQLSHYRNIWRYLRRQARIRVLVGDEESGIGLSGDNLEDTTYCRSTHSLEL